MNYIRESPPSFGFVWPIVFGILLFALLLYMKRLHRDRFQRLIQRGLVVFLIGGGALAWYMLSGPGYYAEFNDIRARLSSIDGTSIVDSGGYEGDSAFYENIWAKVLVKGKGIVDFRSLSPQSFKEIEHLILRSVGRFQFIVRGEGYGGVYKKDTGQPVRTEFHTRVINVGPEGPFSELFPFPLVNVQAVISNYDRIVEILEDWPIYPDYQHFQTDDGTDYYFSLKSP